MESKELATLRSDYLELINHVLPGQIKHPIRFNHCFARVALDWLFGDIWYNHIDTRPAYKALDKTQLQKLIKRLELWLAQPSLLVSDNQASLSYRKKARAKA